MKISKTMWMVIAALVVAGGLFWFVSSTNSTTDTSTSEQTQSEQVEVSSSITFNEDGTVAQYEGVVGETVLVTLKSLTTVTVEESSFGEFVTGINGVQADSSKNFWGYTVNGEFAEVGAGDYVAEEGDTIEWRLTDLN